MVKFCYGEDHNDEESREKELRYNGLGGRFSPASRKMLKKMILDSNTIITGSKLLGCSPQLEQRRRYLDSSAKSKGELLYYHSQENLEYVYKTYVNM